LGMLCGRLRRGGVGLGWAAWAGGCWVVLRWSVRMALSRLWVAGP
jgi:hypothetical protein